VQEALLALWLEARFTKDELLTIYLNRVYLGAGTFGIDAAARLYFGVPARRLTPGQAAVLAGLPKAPSRYNPRVNPSAAVDRAIEVLGAMVETGVLPAAAAMAEAERIHFPPAPSRDAGWFADWVRDGIGDHAPPTSDLLLRTTLDARLQAAVELRLEAMLASQGRAAGVSQGAVVAIEAASGAVRAMAGGRDYRRSPFNRATQARRQPGSAFKPFVFLAAIEAGVRPDDGVADGPINLGGWTPGNGNWRSRGEITVEDAFAHSVNTAAVRLMQRAGGARKVGAVAQRLGLPGPFPRDASIALGTAEVDAARPRHRLCPLRQWRPPRRAFRHCRDARGGPPDRLAAARPHAGDHGGCRRGDAADDGGNRRPRHRPGGGRVRPRGRRQDRDDAGQSRCVVHRHRRRSGDGHLARQ
jgi:penicillin-binding protein 1A